MVRTLEGKHPSYYEAVLQLREVKVEIHPYVKTEIEQKKIPVTKIVELKNGVDIYLADSQFTRGLGKKLQQRFGGNLTITSSLFGRKKGKEIYRVTVLFRGVPFSSGEEVEYQSEPHKVIRCGKEIILQNKKTHLKIRVNIKEAKKIKKTN